jgi:hypothetical protein
MRAPSPSRTRVRGALALAAAALLGGCVLLPPPPPGYSNPLLVSQVIRVLRVDEPSPAFYRERARLEAMGPELDAVLLGLVDDPSVDENVRGNALLLLADRRPPGTLALLRRHLAANASETVRVAAIRGLQRFAPDSAGARNALRAAVGDASAAVRLNVLQRMDVEDAPLVRGLLRREGDAQVRTIAGQLLAFLEARGAPLGRDSRGDLRAIAPEGSPQLVFHPTWTDTLRGVDVGSLWVELPNASLLPLAQEVLVVEGVVPAYFDPTRTAVVYEAAREVRVRDLVGGGTVSMGPGLAPRAIPFTRYFVFAREVPEGRVTGRDGVTVALYHLFRGSFAGGEPVRVGALEAQMHPAVLGGASPVRVMVVGEAREGLVLRAPGMSPVPLPGPVFGAPAPPR